MTPLEFRILVVDDNPAIQKDFRKIFAASQLPSAPSEAEAILFGDVRQTLHNVAFRLESAMQGLDALALMREAVEQGNPYALAFVDVRMPPGMNGIETTDGIWKIDPHVQIVICTAYSDYSWSDVLTKLGRSDQLVILKKPFDTIEVLQLASALTEKWRLAAESRANLVLLESRVAERTADLSQMTAHLQESESQYRLLFDGNPQPMWVFLVGSSRFVMVNRAATERYGYSVEEFMAMTVPDLHLPDAIPSVQQSLDVAGTRGKHFSTRRHRKRDGSMIDVEISSDQMIFEGQPARLVLAHDVTERTQAELKIKRLNRVYAVMSGINTLIVRERNRDELFRKACEVAVEHGRFRMAWIGIIAPGNKLTPVAFAGASPEYQEAVARCFSQTHGTFHVSTPTARAILEKRATYSNDALHDPHILFKEHLRQCGVKSMAVLPLVVSGQVEAVVTFFSSEPGFFDEVEMVLLSELADNIAFAIHHVRNADRLEYLAQHDELTGLANRARFLGQIAGQMDHAASHGVKLALCLIDVERFRTINDTLGRDCGDEMLREIAGIITRVEGGPQLVARVGVDQFAVMLTPVTLAEDAANRMCNSILAIMGTEFHFNGSNYRISVKGGIALFPEDGNDADALFRNAESALEKAKLSPERFLFYSVKMIDPIAGSLTLENHLRLALERDEFVLFYQPKLDVASGRIIGCEALIRWNDPRTGLVPPGRFIPILEQTGLIQEVGRWALAQAVSDHARWRAAGLLAVPIAVNVSSLQLRHPGFVDEIRSVIASSGGGDAGLEIEVTESMMMQDLKQNVATLQSIREMGVTIAIDDFGTGFSSLAYLSRLPVSALKIDRSFIADMAETPEGLALVSTIINLGHSLKLKIIAEGVETEEQSRLLGLLGCDEMQGYLFSKPVPGDVFEERFLVPRLPLDEQARTSALPALA